MAKCTILYWQDIPSLVEATDGATTKKIQLSQRYQELIDLVAMKKGLAGTDAYLDEWNKGIPEEQDGTPDAVAAAKAEELEGQFDAIRAAALEKC
jgi:hypothetical protein